MAPPNRSVDPPTWCDDELGQRAWEIGVAVAALHADDVDRSARFPAEAVDALTAAGLMAAMVPLELSGGGATMRAVALATRALAHHCSATALVFAMHQMEVACLVAHGGTPGLRTLLGGVATDGLLLANATSEVGLGGVAGQSQCALQLNEGRVRIDKDVLAISYGAYADAILVTARRHPQAVESDQVLLAVRRENATLGQTTTWDTTGLRGTCSAGFHLTSSESADMVFPDSWATIVSRTGGPATAIFLNSVWLGIAESAANIAHAFIRAGARRQIGTPPLNADLLAELAVTLSELRAVMAAFLDRFEDADGTRRLESPATLLALRNLKLSTTTLAIEIVAKASLICGLLGYKRDSPYSLDRHLRDVHGGPLMAHNSRFLAENAHRLLGMRSL